MHSASTRCEGLRIEDAWLANECFEYYQHCEQAHVCVLKMLIRDIILTKRSRMQFCLMDACLYLREDQVSFDVYLSLPSAHELQHQCASATQEYVQPSVGLARNP